MFLTINDFIMIMKKIFHLSTIALFSGVLLFSCNKKEAQTQETTSTPEATNEVSFTNVERKSTDNLDSLTSILVQCLKNQDKSLYVSYCFTTDQEEALANMIQDKKRKKYFQREFGFSLHEELIYFQNILKYIEKSKIDLAKVEKSLIESIDYNKTNYEPIVLKEVIIPILQEGIERDIVYVAVQIDGRWYFTSELSL